MSKQRRHQYTEMSFYLLVCVAHIILDKSTVRECQEFFAGILNICLYIIFLLL